jgi:type II secretory pathway pseudopilin PulG
MGDAAAGIPVIGGMLGSSAQQQAANAQAAAIQAAANNYMQQVNTAAAPSLSAGVTGLTGLKRMAGYYGSKLGQESDILNAQKAAALSGINRQRQAALAESNRMWLTSGNAGRGRGEALRIGQAATEAANKTNLGFAQAQDAYKGANANTYSNLLSGLAGFGSQGLGAVSGASGNVLNSNLSAANSLYGGQIGGATDMMSGLMAGLGMLQGDKYMKMFMEEKKKENK